jgi:hypothetical protein
MHQGMNMKLRMKSPSCRNEKFMKAPGNDYEIENEIARE